MQNKNFLLSILTGILLACLLTACDADNEFNSTHYCRLVVDNSIHQDNVLSSAMNRAAPGIFCNISLLTKGERMFFRFQSNAGGETSEKPFNDVDKRNNGNKPNWGIYNNIIIGYGHFDPYPFYAFDAICPTCYELKGKYAVIKMSSNAQATCPQCNTVYDLGNGGIIVSGDATRKLYRYRGSTSGQYGILTVTN